MTSLTPSLSLGKSKSLPVAQRLLDRRSIDISFCFGDSCASVAHGWLANSRVALVVH